MEIAYMVTLVLVLGGATPETRVVSQGIVDKTECYFRTRTLNDLPPTIVDDVTGRKVLSRQYLCTPVDPVAIRRDIDKLKQ